ncbi:hypothetical protein YKV033c [Yokapox virus]|uniref:Protein OPG061 n=1 Tax=Yokapox virus TaxID=1076255 RepID=G3EIB1_9POXV|nr:hypothetical protein YKV033c [Yokapox virus]AEN03622.1 unknown protein [Yokapox virus]
MKVVIITSISSLFDTSIYFQRTVCRNYCKYHSFDIIYEIDNIGYISENTLLVDKWKDIITNNEIDGLIFYRVKQIDISVGKFYNIIMMYRSNNIIMHFVKDSLIFDGYPPSFRRSQSVIRSCNRKKIKDLILLMNMKTCNKNIISEFIYSNFESVDILLSIINSNNIWVSSVLNSINYKKNISTVSRFKRFINKLKMYKDDKCRYQVDEICSNIDKMVI